MNHNNNIPSINRLFAKVFALALEDPIKSATEVFQRVLDQIDFTIEEREGISIDLIVRYYLLEFPTRDQLLEHQPTIQQDYQTIFPRHKMGTFIETVIQLAEHQ